MPYLVRTMPRAERDLEAIYIYIEAESSDAAKNWFVGLISAIETLSEQPQRGPRAPENKKLYQLLYGNKPHVYRIIYSVNTAARRVDIIHVRHGARDSFKT